MHAMLILDNLQKTRQMKEGDDRQTDGDDGMYTGYQTQCKEIAILVRICGNKGDRVVV
jgi:hypothetical protein